MSVATNREYVVISNTDAKPNVTGPRKGAVEEFITAEGVPMPWLKDRVPGSLGTVMDITEDDARDLVQRIWSVGGDVDPEVATSLHLEPPAT